MKKLLFLLGLYHCVLFALDTHVEEFEANAIAKKIDDVYYEIKYLRTYAISLRNYLRNDVYELKDTLIDKIDVDIRNFNGLLREDTVTQIILDVFNHLSDKEKLALRKEYELLFANTLTIFNFIKKSHLTSSSYKGSGNLEIGEALLSLIKMHCISYRCMKFLFVENPQIRRHKMTSEELDFFNLIISFGLLSSRIFELNLLQQVILE